MLLQDRYGEPQDAIGLLRKGPEPLRSHFSTRYGMVLKLLHFRSLDSARKFVQRSFFNYLGAHSADSLLALQCTHVALHERHERRCRVRQSK